MKTKILGLLAVGLLVGPVAEAATISYTDYVPGPGTGNYSNLNFSGTFVLPQFDAVLGTLTGVAIEYTSAWQNVSSSYTNNGTSGGSARLAASALSTLSGPLITNLITNPLLYDTGLQPVGAGGTISVAPMSGLNGPTPVAVSALLSSFIGNANLAFDLSQVFVVSNTFIGSFNGSQRAEGRGELRITYTYDQGGTPVPEPGTLALLSLGLASLGLSRRRKTH